MDGESVTLRVLIADQPRLTRVRRGMELVKFRAVDESGSVEITYFNQSYMANQLNRGDEVRFFGRVEVKGTRRTMVNPVYETADKPNGQVGRIVPVYRLTAGLNQRTVQQAVRQGLDACGEQLPDLLPDEVRERQQLVQARWAYEQIHFPADFGTLELARRRLIFEELFVLACALGDIRRKRVAGDGIVLPTPDFEEFYQTLPFSPTLAQRRAIGESAADMASGKAMSRLVQGDVGSGKTLVAAALIWSCWKGGHMSAFMAPTELLAEQHFETLTGFLAPLGLRLGRLTGSLTAKEKREVKQKLRDGELDCVIGTHALFSEDVAYRDLGLVVTDEQHRFGVRQRTTLSEKGDQPNVLVMSATPIPRTLSLILYGDLDISIVDELPPGRTPVQTRIVPEAKREGLYGFLREEVKKGRQVYFVCPLVEESEAVEAQPAELLYEELRTKKLPDLNIELVHGRMKSADKDAALERFRTGAADVLVSTTVIEVGVNVPNATVMVIENAERFGLAQLHQLRGRVGRGAHESWCFLMAEPNPRLRFLCSTNDGFKVAQKDMELRGPGELFGTRQSGALSAGIGALAGDTELLKLTHDEAHALMRHPDSPDARTVVALARERFADRLEGVGVN